MLWCTVGVIQRSAWAPVSAAVAVESGKRKVACFRRACNKRLRQAFCTLANSICESLTEPARTEAHSKLVSTVALGTDPTTTEAGRSG